MQCRDVALLSLGFALGVTFSSMSQASKREARAVGFDLPAQAIDQISTSSVSTSSSPSHPPTSQASQLLASLASTNSIVPPIVPFGGGHEWSGPKEFAETVVKLGEPITDKVAYHTYDVMYGLFLLPWREVKNFKMLEIGLGCNMVYGPGASVKIWSHFFPRAELWEAEFDAKCVAELQQMDSLPSNMRVVVGSQSNVSTLQRWIQETGGGFDVVIDDGGHTNMMIKTSFDHLWPHVKPGGVYFIEDLAVGRLPAYKDSNDAVMSDVIQDWIEQLLIYGNSEKKIKHALPGDVISIFVQPEAIAILKNPGNVRVGPKYGFKPN